MRAGQDADARYGEGNSLEFHRRPEIPRSDPLTQGADQIDAARGQYPGESRSITRADVDRRGSPPASSQAPRWRPAKYSPGAAPSVWGDHLVVGDTIYTNEPGFGLHLRLGDHLVWGTISSGATPRSSIVWGPRPYWAPPCLGSNRSRKRQRHLAVWQRDRWRKRGRLRSSDPRRRDGAPLRRRRRMWTPVF